MWGLFLFRLERLNRDLADLVKGQLVLLAPEETKVKVTFFIGKLMLKPNSNYLHEPPAGSKDSSQCGIKS